jgi:hypothetical protein
MPDAPVQWKPHQIICLEACLAQAVRTSDLREEFGDVLPHMLLHFAADRIECHGAYTTTLALDRLFLKQLARGILNRDFGAPWPWDPAWSYTSEVDSDRGIRLDDVLLTMSRRMSESGHRTAWLHSGNGVFILVTHAPDTAGRVRDVLDREGLLCQETIHEWILPTASGDQPECECEDDEGHQHEETCPLHRHYRPEEP